MVRLPLKYENDRQSCTQAFFHCGPTVGLAGERGNFLLLYLSLHYFPRQNVTKAINLPRLLFLQCIFLLESSNLVHDYRAYSIILIHIFFSPYYYDYYDSSSSFSLCYIVHSSNINTETRHIGVNQNRTKCVECLSLLEDYCVLLRVTFIAHYTTTLTFR